MSAVWGLKAGEMSELNDHRGSEGKKKSVLTIIIRYVRREPSNRRITPRSRQHLLIQLCGGLKIARPPKPIRVRSVNIQIHIKLLELRDRVGEAFEVCFRGALALGDVHVCDHVSETVGFEDDGVVEVQVFGRVEEEGDCVDEVEVFCEAVIGEVEFPVGGFGAAVAV